MFGEVQRRRLFGDGKTFADAVPRWAAGDIVEAFRAGVPWQDDALRAFVIQSFDLPDCASAQAGVRARREAPNALPRAISPDWTPAFAGVRGYIAATWSQLTREPVEASGSALALPYRFVVPGGRFRELYYWDSYFTMLGLARDRPDLVEEMIDNFTDLIERYGRIPNGTRSYYLGRSQPPFFALMLDLSVVPPSPRRLAAARAEYDFWMRGERVVELDDARLNRFWDDHNGPRDESWAEDVATAAASGRPEAKVWRDLRAGAESSWDFSSRWLGDGRGLATIRTTRIVPVCLNALLYAAEVRLELTEAAAARRVAVDRQLWTGERYADLDLDTGPTPHVSAAMLYPLFAGCASQAQADAVAALAEAKLLAPGGLRTTLSETGEQWDAPNGWAPLQWIAVQGLRRYGHDALAARIAERWLATVERHFAATGALVEKYDVERGVAGGGGEYAVQDGFGWTNGVTAALLDRR